MVMDRISPSDFTCNLVKIKNNRIHRQFLHLYINIEFDKKRTP